MTLYMVWLEGEPYLLGADGFNELLRRQRPGARIKVRTYQDVDQGLDALLREREQRLERVG